MNVIEYGLTQEEEEEQVFRYFLPPSLLNRVDVTE